MSVRDDPTLYLGTAKRAIGGTVLGGAATTAAGAHKLDGPEHLAPDDTTTLDASTTRHGLLPKLSGDATDALLGDGTWGPAGTPNAELNIEGGQSVIDDDTFPVAGATEDFDPTNGNVFPRTLDASLVGTILAPVGTGAATIEFWFTQDGSGGHTVTLAASGGSVIGDISAHTLVAGETFRVVADRIPGTTNDWVVDLVGGSGGASFATPAIVLGTAAAAGAATTTIRSDATIVAFDATAPTTQAFGDAAAAGSAAVAARRDHKHAMPAAPATGSSGSDHEHIVNVVFSGDASTTVWELPAAPVDSTSVAVYVTGSRSIAWALSGALLTTLTFDSAPASAANNIVIDITAAVA